MNTITKPSPSLLTPRQNAFLKAYTDATSPSFGNCYQSAISAGYSDATARNLTHLKPEWLSDNIGQMTVIQPDDIKQALTGIAYSQNEPTILRLRALELMMKNYKMIGNGSTGEPKTVSISINLTGDGSLPPKGY